MRSTALLIGLILAGETTAALAQERQLGLKAGGSYARLQFDPDADSFRQGRFGVTGGGFAVRPFNARFGLQVEALFSPKGASEDIEGLEGTITLQLDYLDIPLLLRVAGPAIGSNRFHLFGGPSIGVRLSANRQTKVVGDFFNDGIVEDVGDMVDRFDLGMVAGAGVDVGRRLTIDGRYSWGITNVNGDEANPVTIKTRMFAVMGGFRF